MIGDRLIRCTALMLIAVVPLSLCTVSQDVFFGPWRAGLWTALAPLLAASALAWSRGRRRVAASPSTLPWIGFLLWALVATAWSANPADSFRRTLELTGAGCALWLGTAFARDWGRMATAVLLAVSATTVYALFQAAGYDWLPWSTRFGARAFGTLGNPDYYAGHMILVLPVLVSALMGSTRGGSALAVAAVAWFSGLLFSQVRGAWLAGGLAAAGAGGWIAWRGCAERSERRKLSAAGLLGAAAVLASLAVSEGLRSRVLSMVSFGNYDATGRRYLWRVAGRIWAERPLVGFGTGSFRFEFPRYQHLGATMGMDQFKPYNYSEHAHHELLQFGAELGAVGVLLFCWGVAAWAWPWIRTMVRLAREGSREEWWRQLGLGTGLWAVFWYGWVNFPYQIVPTALLWWGMLGVSIGRMTPGAPRWVLPRSVAWVAGAGLAGLGLIGALTAVSELVGTAYLRELHGRLQIGRHAGARELGERGAKLIGHDVRIHRWLCRLGVAEKDVGLVEREVKARLAVHPHLLDALADRAAVYRQAGDVDRARELYEDLVARAPNFVSAWGELGVIAFQAGEYERALEAFSRAAELQDGHAVWHHQRAAAFGMLERYREALEADEKAVARDPGFVDAYVGLALSARSLGELPRALAAAREAYRRSPADPRAAGLLRSLQTSPR